MEKPGNNNHSASPNPMDEKKDVQQSNDEKIEQDFPGFPHHPAKPVAMGKETDDHKEDRQVEENSSAENTTGVSQRFEKNEEPGSGEPDHLPNAEQKEQSKKDEMGVPQNITNEDLENSKNIPGTNPEKAADR